jgi:hypothetical protein
LVFEERMAINNDCCAKLFVPIAAWHFQWGGYSVSSGNCPECIFRNSGLGFLIGSQHLFFSYNTPFKSAPLLPHCRQKTVQYRRRFSKMCFNIIILLFWISRPLYQSVSFIILVGISSDTQYQPSTRGILDE